MAHLEFFPESYLALQQELADNHPELAARIAKHPPSEFEFRIAEIAAYCDVILDGYYTPEDLEKLCNLLWTKLKQKSTGLILLN